MKHGKLKGRAKPEQRRQLKAERRRARLDARGRARKHWERRRRGQCGSAPELKNRPVGLEGLEDVLLGGGGQKKPDARSGIRRMFRGVHPLSDEQRYLNQERGARYANEQADKAWAAAKAG